MKLEKETSVFKRNAIANGIATAASKATNFITELANGIFVHAEGTPSDPTASTATGVNITDQVNIIRNGEPAAKFGSSAQIGKDAKSRAIIDNHSFQMYYGDETNPYVYLSDFRNDNGYATLTDTFIGDGQHSAYTTGYTVYSITSVTVDDAAVDYIISADEESSSGGTVLSPKEITLTDGEHNVNLANGSVLKITYTTTDEVKAFTFGDRVGSGDSIGNYSMTVGVANGASGQKAFSQGVDCHASGLYTFASGHMCHANGEFSHAEGNVAIANGNCSHAEGFYTEASGYVSHAEGYHTQATGQHAHSEGYYTEASGAMSHAGGHYVKAAYNYQTAIGKYNENKSDNLFEVGNGTSDSARSNAFEVDKDGNAIIKGQLTQVPTTITPSITVSTGSLSSATITKCGNVVSLKLVIYNASSIAAGSNIFEGTITNAAYRPKDYATGVGYFGNHVFPMQISSAGGITVRHVGTAAVSTSSSNTVWVSATYIVS